MRRVVTAILLLVGVAALAGCSGWPHARLTIRLNSAFDGPAPEVAIWQGSRGRIATLPEAGTDRVTLLALVAPTASDDDTLSISFPPDPTRYPLASWDTEQPLSGQLTVYIEPVSEHHLIGGAILDQTTWAPEGGTWHGLYPEGY